MSKMNEILLTEQLLANLLAPQQPHPPLSLPRRKHGPRSQKQLALLSSWRPADRSFYRRYRTAPCRAPPAACATALLQICPASAAGRKYNRIPAEFPQSAACRK